jgi:hypothetical protein
MRCSPGQGLVYKASRDKVERRGAVAVAVAAFRQSIRMLWMLWMLWMQGPQLAAEERKRGSKILRNTTGARQVQVSEVEQLILFLQLVSEWEESDEQIQHRGRAKFFPTRSVVLLKDPKLRDSWKWGALLTGKL